MTMHLHNPSGHFIGQTRLRGGRRWRTVTGRHGTRERALSAAVLKMGKRDGRARVLFVDDGGWYEPNVVMQASRA